MKTKPIVSFILLAFSSISLFSQGNIIFSSDYSSAQGWIQVGADVQIANGQLEYINNAEDGSQRRVYTPLGSSLSDKSPGAWCAEFEFYFDSVAAGRGSDHMLLGLTAGTQDPHNDCPNISCTGYPPGTQDCIGVVFYTTGTTTSDRQLAIRVREGANSSELTSAGIPATSPNTQYYIRLEHPGPGSLVLHAFSDPQFSVAVPGSPTSLSYSPTLSGLNTVQHANTAKGWITRHLNGHLDNLEIFWCNITSVDDPIAQSATFYPNPSKGEFLLSGATFSPEDHIEVFDVRGRMVKRCKADEGVLDLTDQADGLYLVQIGEGKPIYKLLKQK